MIFMNDFKAEPQILRDAMMEGVQRVINSGWYVLGSEVQKFEAEWARICGTTNAIGVGNGMDAIEIILRGLEIGPGDEVITTPMTAFASVLAIYRAGATPVLADIDPTTALMSIESATRCISGRTKAILLVHLYGQLCNIDLWQKFCDEYGISLVEDCAQAHLASIDEKCAGSFGVAAAFSFYPTKNIGAFGDSGAIVTDNPKIFQKIKMLRNYGSEVKYHNEILGVNSRMDEIQASILSIKLKYYLEYLKNKNHIAQRYLNEIKNDYIKLPVVRENSEHVWHLFVVFSDYRDELKKYLEEKNIITDIHYPIPPHLSNAYKDLNFSLGDFPITEKFANSVLSLPIYEGMSDSKISYVIRVINDFIL